VHFLFAFAYSVSGVERRKKKIQSRQFASSLGLEYVDGDDIASRYLKQDGNLNQLYGTIPQCLYSSKIPSYVHANAITKALQVVLPSLPVSNVILFYTSSISLDTIFEIQSALNWSMSSTFFVQSGGNATNIATKSIHSSSSNENELMVEEKGSEQEIRRHFEQWKRFLVIPSNSSGQSAAISAKVLKQDGNASSLTQRPLASQQFVKALEAL